MNALFSKIDNLVAKIHTEHIKDEPGMLVIGTINKKHWTAVVTYRGIKTRIISVRRSRPEEVQMYES